LRSGPGDDRAHGQLVPGAPATFAVWDTAVDWDTWDKPAETAEAVAVPRCRRTVLRGEVIYDVEAT
jgi:predicted amidohydrolase YtcJ